MERLTLNRRPKTGDKVECLPAGDGLPIWSTIPLDAKLPMMKNPKGSVTLFTTKLGEPKHKCKQEYDFDLRDPYGKYICNEYQPLHDPHLKAHFKSQVMRRHLIRKGFISEDGKVLCSLKEFNKYRQYLRHVFFLEIARERKEELEKIHRQTSEQRLHDVDNRLSRSTIVRERMQQQREHAMHRLNTEITTKAERLEKRLQEIRDEVTQREKRHREEAERRQQNVYKNQQETEQRKYVQMKKWRQQERLRSKLMEDRDIHRKLLAEMKCIAKWNERKFAQQEKLAHDKVILKQEEEERQENITRREKFMLQQRHRLERKLAKLKQQMRQEKTKRDELYAKRFEEKLASGDYRIWTKRRDKRRGRSKTFSSTWKLADILSNLTLTDTHKQLKGQPFMTIIEEAFDGFSDITSQQDEEDMEALQEKAREIVQGVISKVTHEIFPAYLKMLSEDEGQVAIKSRSVRFCTVDDHVHIEMEPAETISREEDFESDYIGMRPVSDHILTPVASQMEIQKLEAEAILGSPEIGDKTSSVTFVETLLLRLLDDLNSGKLSKNDIMKLASYSMDIIQSTETGSQIEGTIEEDAEYAETGSPFEASSSSSVIAKKMVDFTLGKILCDIQTGNVHPDDLALLTVSLLDDSSQSTVSSTSISVSESGLDNYIDETLRAATSSAVDPRDDSPVCEALLDEFMINTLKHLITDLENDVLSKSQIETLAMSVKDETRNILSMESDDEIQDSAALQRILSEILGQIQKEEIDVNSLYQIVFAVVYSYNIIKAPPTPCYENRITNLMRDIMYVAEQKAIAGELDNVNVNIMQEANRRLSRGTLDVNQIEEISSSIISTVSKPEVICRTTTSDIARSIVEDALTRTKQKIETENTEYKFSLGVQNVAEAVISTTANMASQDKTEVAETLLHVLKNLRDIAEKCDVIDKEDLEDIDILISQIVDKEIDSGQVEEIAITVARVLKSPVKSDSSISADLVIADVLRKVNTDLQRGSVENCILQQMIEVVSTAVRAAQAMDAHSPALLGALSSFLRTVLSYVTHKVQTGEFTDNDIKELSKAMKDNIDQNDSLFGLKTSVFDEIQQPTEPSEEEEKVVSPAEKCVQEVVSEENVQLQNKSESETVLEYFQKLLDDIETGQIPIDVINCLGKRLINCGKTLLDTLSDCSSAVLTPGSDVIADDVVEEVIRTLQLEIVSGSLTQDSVKEITKSIISSTSSKSDLADKIVGHTLRGIHRDVERGYEPARLPSVPTLDHSPSASTIASHVVLHTIEAIHSELSRTMISDSLIVSIASSIISLITEDQDRPLELPHVIGMFKGTLSAITECLKNDSIARPEAERIFCIILEKYKDFVCRGDQTMAESLPDEDITLVNDLVTETLHNIERSVQKGMLSMKEFSIPSLPHSESTSVAADQLVGQCLETIRQDLSTDFSFPHAHYKDISDFILDILQKLYKELSDGTISSLSMAHFFQVISDDHSDLKTLEGNASENLSKVIDDIIANKTNSVYIQGILETYLTSEPISSRVFSDPVKAVESILINVSSDILTKFVKATLQNILIEMREASSSDAEKPPSVFAIRSASSLIAENVIQEVITRIKGDMTKSVHKLHGKVSKRELENAASKLLCESPVKSLRGSPHDLDNKHGSSHQSMSSVQSRELEDIVLETLHNIVSNLRFEQSVQTHKQGKSKDDFSSDMSSEVQDFVLHTLQNIVTDLQDRRSQMELGVAKTQSQYSSSIELVSGESREATAYVNEVLQTVLNDMKHEFAVREQTMTEGSSNADSFPDASRIEAAILECLQNAILNEPSRNEANNLDQNQRKDVQQIVIETIVATLKNVKEHKVSQKDLITVNNALVKFLDEKENTETEMALQDQVCDSLKNVLAKVQEMEIDESTLNRIATQVATLGMDINVFDRKSPDVVGSSSSMSSSAIGDLVKDVLSKISQQMEAETQQGVHMIVNEYKHGEIDINFNRNKSASSSRTRTSLKTEDSATSDNVSTDQTNNNGKCKEVKFKVKERQKLLTERRATGNTSLNSSKTQEAHMSSPQYSFKKVRSPAGKMTKSTKIQTDRNSLPKVVSPVNNQMATDLKEIKTLSTAKLCIQKGNKSVKPKHNKSGHTAQRSGGKVSIPVSSTVSRDSVKLSKKSRQNPSKKTKGVSSKDSLNVDPTEDPSVVKSICGAHKTKISIREDQC